VRRRSLRFNCKAHGLTVVSIKGRYDLSLVEVSSIFRVEVKFFDSKETTSGKGGLLCQTDAEARKLGDQTGLETLVVQAVNYEC
jgi:hypothetical protein